MANMNANEMAVFPASKVYQVDEPDTVRGASRDRFPTGDQPTEYVDQPGDVVKLSPESVHYGSFGQSGENAGCGEYH
jgi:hypothetical protein